MYPPKHFDLHWFSHPIVILEAEKSGGEWWLQVLHQNDAIQSILVIMQEHRTEVLRQQAVWMVERILRDHDLARSIAMDASVHTALVDAFRYGNNNAKQLAERALKVLNRIPTSSGVFTKPR